MIEGHEVSPGESDHMYQMVEASHPAFVCLPLLSLGTPIDTSIMPTPDYCEPSSSNMFVLNGDRIKQAEQESSHTIRHGPALTIHNV